SLAQFAAFLGLGLGLAFPHLRRAAMAALLVAAVASLAGGLLAPGARSLETVHHYAGYEGAALEVSMVAFPTGTVTADGWLWPLPFVGFAALWLLLLARLGGAPLRNPLLLPLLLAWTATATWLLMQALAAPSAVVQPAGIDRVLWPAGLALALLVARSVNGILPLIVLCGGGVMAARLPAALFSKIASDQHLGTSLDISGVIHIVNPMTQEVFDPALVPGSGPQQFWLIWLEHLIIYPALHSMSLFGIGLGVHLWHKHAGDEA
ncbi:MAG: hypothetical protein KDC98_02535, partial [Planctomycetes bacterium]|nr:hypothetical protein [Planctomycetota bacterium]